MSIKMYLSYRINDCRFTGTRVFYGVLTTEKVVGEGDVFTKITTSDIGRISPTTALKDAKELAESFKYWYVNQGYKGTFDITDQQEAS